MPSDSPSLAKPLKVLESQPSSDELLRALRDIAGTELSNLEQLRVASTLLNRTIPETSSLLSAETKEVLLDLLANRVGLSQLVEKAKGGNGVYASVLADFVTQSRLESLVDGLEAKKRQGQAAAYFRSIRTVLLNKVVAALNEAYLKDKDNERLESASRTYLDSLFSAVLAKAVPGQYYRQLVDGILSEDSDLAGKYFEDASAHSALVKLYNGVSDARFFGALVRYVRRKVDTDESAQAYLTLLKEVCPESVSSIVKAASNTTEYPAVKVLLALLSDKPLFADLQHYTSEFGSKGYIDGVPMSTQTSFAKFLVTLASYCTPDQLDDLSRDGGFLDMVTARLDSHIEGSKTLGMFVADYVYEKIKGEPLFKIEGYQKRRKEILDSMGMFQLVSTLSVEEAIKVSKKQATNGQAVVEIPLDVLREPPVQQLTIDFDSDMEDSDDDGGAERVHKVAIPVYLKELLAYLISDSKDQRCNEKHRVAHLIAPQMIRAKKGLPEMEYYSNSLMDVIISMSNTDNFDEFNSWKLSTMIAITVSDFKNSTDLLLRTFLNADISLSQRVMILSCLSLASRELSGGYDDSFVVGKEGVDRFEPKRLPENLHKQFIRYEGTDSRFLESGRGNLESLASSVGSLSMEGTVTRMSSKLVKDRSGKPAAGGVTRDISFINNELPKLFFSLISIWETVSSVTGSGFKLGNFSSILNTEYFRTLQLVFECAVPSSTQLIEMTKDLLLTIDGELKVLSTQQKLDADTFEAILKALRAPLEVDSSLLPMKALFSNELLSIYNSLGSLIEGGAIVEDRLKGNTAYIIRKISSII